MKRIALLVLMIVLGNVIIYFIVGCSENLSGIGTISTDNYANRTLEYYYFLPEDMAFRKGSVLVCVPGLSGRGEDFVSKELINFSEEKEIPIISPSFMFDDKNWSFKTSYQYPEHWSGEALLDILNDFEKRCDYKVSGLYLLGVSAGAQFCQRFTFWKPEICIACATYAAGGSIEFTRKIDVPYFVGIGVHDTDRIYFAKAFRDTGRQVGVFIDYREYNNAHDMPREFLDDAIHFIESH